MVALVCIVSISSVAVDPQLEVKVTNSYNDSKLCPGEAMIFTCETRATDNQTWIISNSNLSDRITVNVNELGILQNSTIFDNAIVHVILEESFDKNGFRVMKSMLRITISQNTDYDKNVSVLCQNDELGTWTNNITMEVGGQGTKNSINFTTSTSLLWLTYYGYSALNSLVPK